MAFHFSQIFWGLLFVFLDFSINGFDLLADGVGYVIVAVGCRCLSPLSTTFTTARSLCFVLGALWLIGIAFHGDLAILLGLITTVLDCAMIWHLLGGIRQIAMSRQRHDLADRASNRRVAYVAIMIAASLFTFVMRGSSAAGPLALILVVGMLFLIAMILHLILRVRVELETQRVI